MIRLFLLSTISLCALGFVPNIAYAATQGETRTVDDLEPNISRLLQSDAPDAFFVIRIVDSPDFLQFYSFSGMASLDFPMITKRQKSNRRKIKKATKTLGLACKTNKDMTLEFIDCQLTQTPDEIHQIALTLLNQIYGVTEDTALTFEANGFELTASE